VIRLVALLHLVELEARPAQRIANVTCDDGVLRRVA
jgi:hypothetical protein